jgi:ATPase subunit of ABC transporter with duplicated ATPase domains
MIAVKDLGMTYGAHTLFEGVTFQLNPGSRYGLVGANGSGKTTLLRLLSGREEPTEGSVSRAKRVRLGVLEQDHFQYEDTRIIEVVMAGHDELWRAMTEKEHLLELAHDDFDGERYAILEDIIVSHDGYAHEARCGEILEGLGIPTEHHDRPLSMLSGGFKLRVLLARVLASDPALLLLDEPTNHLDILSIRWLEKFLTDYTGCAVVISHDHRFLDNVCTHILDIDYQTVTAYTGDYEAFVAAKEAERQRREAEIAKREKQIADHQAFVDRFRAKATKARQAQSKVKLIERTVIERLPPSSRRYPKFRFRQQRPSGKKVLELDGISKSFGDNRVLVDVGLHVRRGDRLAIIGPNGIGKSTLLKVAMGHLEPDDGTVTWGHETAPGYFAQDHRDQLGGSDATVEGWLGAACPGESTGFVRGRLGNVLFERDDVTKKVANLSGGEAARLIFARLGVQQPNVLVLDEPTNHLDLEAIEALVEALDEYEGTLILVSHDRWFVSRLATRVLEITADGANDYPGSYEEYVASCGDDHLDTQAATLRQRRDKRRRRGEVVQEPPSSSINARRRKDLELRRDVITADIEGAEARIEQINQRFCESGFFDITPLNRIRALQQEQQSLTTRVEELLAEWERIERELEG